jgi:hypothetical protein
MLPLELMLPLQLILHLMLQLVDSNSFSRSSCCLPQGAFFHSTSPKKPIRAILWTRNPYPPLPKRRAEEAFLIKPPPRVERGRKDPNPKFGPKLLLHGHGRSGIIAPGRNN